MPLVAAAGEGHGCTGLACLCQVTRDETGQSDLQCPHKPALRTFKDEGLPAIRSNNLLEPSG